MRSCATVAGPGPRINPARSIKTESAAAIAPGQRLKLPSGNVVELRGSHHDALGGIWRCCYVRGGLARPGREQAHLLTLRAEWLLRYGREFPR